MRFSKAGVRTLGGIVAGAVVLVGGGSVVARTAPRGGGEARSDARVAARPGELPPSCNAFFALDELADIVGALDAAAATEPVWDDYTIAQHPIALVDAASATGGEEAGGCAAIWRAGEPLERLGLAEPAPLTAMFYSFWNGDRAGDAAQAGWLGLLNTMAHTAPELEAAARARGDSRMLVLGIPLVYADHGELGAILAQAAPPPLVLLTLFAVHESYHLHSQFPTFLDQPRRYSWPGWHRQVDRNQLIATCYQASEEVSAVHAAELELLLEAWDHLWGAPGRTRDVASARRAAAAYVAQRRARYDLLAEVSVPAAGGPVSCELGEAVWELTEGAASWVAGAAAVRGNVMSREQARDVYVRALNPAFYQSGSFQLWVLDGLLGGDAVRSMGADIGRSNDARENIFARFEQEVVSPGRERTPGTGRGR
jgi:hypothetical protein